MLFRRFAERRKLPMLRENVAGDKLGYELRVSEREIRGANSPKRGAKRTSVRERRLRAKASAQLARSVERFLRSAERRSIDVSARLPYAFDLAIR